MIRAILVGLDGSPYSDAAVELGLQWAKRFDCLLVGVGVIDEPTIRGNEPITAVSGHYQTTYEHELAGARRSVEGWLERFTLRATEAQVAHKLLEDVGLPCEEILREAERYDLIMLGQKTYFHCFSHSADSDTLDRVLRNAVRPVVAVPERLGDGSGVLVAYDGSHEAARALAAFVPTGLHQLGEVTVLTVGTESNLQAAKTADRAIEYLKLHDIEAKPHPVVSLLAPGKVVLDEAKNTGVELIVMGAKGRSKIWEFLLSSVTQRALHESPIPLFMFH
jgi:nucleotide-binding universal stress UspA family protein